MPRRYGGNSWYRQHRYVRNLVLAGQPCWRCGQPIDLELKAGGPRPNPMALTIGHVRPLIEGGDPLDLANILPEHRRCNVVAENLRRQGATQGPRVTNPSRTW